MSGSGFGFSLGGGRPRGRQATSLSMTHDVEEKDEYPEAVPVTAISQSGALISSEKKEEVPDYLVIPVEEGWKRRRAPTFHPSMMDHDRAEDDKSMDENDAAEPIAHIGALGEGDPMDEDLSHLPPILRNRVPGLDKIEDEQEKFLADVAARPDEASLDAYVNTPIEKFGEGLLRGMGWKPGQPVGKTNKSVVKVVTHIRRPQRLGLGATPKPMSQEEIDKQNNRIIKQGETRGPQPVMALPREADGRVRHVKELDEELVEVKEPFFDGCRVEIIDGPHSGLTARLQKKTLDGVATLLLPSEENVRVSLRHLKQLDDSHPVAGQRRDQHHREDRDRDRDRSRHHSRDEDRHHRHHRHYDERRSPDSDRKEKKRSRSRSPESHQPLKKHKSSHSSSTSRSTAPSPSPGSNGSHSNPPHAFIWAMRDIRVKIVNKRLREGKYYCKVGWIHDVMPQGRCSVLLEDGGQLLDNLDQNDIESVVPQAGGRVRVLKGEYRGQTGKILDRDRDRNKVHVQIDEDFEVIGLTFDDVAQCH